MFIFKTEEEPKAQGGMVVLWIFLQIRRRTTKIVKTAALQPCRRAEVSTCLYSQPRLTTGAFGFLLIELDLFPKLWTFLEARDV